jgi:hypothetical protein
VSVGSASAAKAGASEYFSESVKDFGTTPRGPVLVHYFVVRNTSGQPVSIGQPRVSCGCTSASVIKSQLAPGETTAVVAHMDTRRISTAGVTKQVTVYVPFLSPYLEEVSLVVRTVVRDDLVLTPDTLAFGTVRKGQGGKAATKVTFYSDPNWQITEVASTGIYIKPAVTPVGKQGSQVTYEVAATLDPACPVGNWTADVWIKTTGAGVEKLRIPVTVNVVAPIAANPDALRFGDVKLGETAEKSLIVQGSEPFKVIEVKGADDAVKISAPSPDARPVHILKLELTPKEAGVVSKTLEVVTDSKDQPVVTVPLSAKVSQ